MLDFPDAPGQSTPEHYANVLFGDHPPEAPFGSLRDYFLEVSYGQLNVTGQVNHGNIKYYRMQKPSSSYEGRFGDLFTDAVTVARSAGFDFGPFDTDNDGFVDLLILIISGMQFRFTNGTISVDTGSTNAEGEPVFIYRFFGLADDSTFPTGIFAHEFAHILGARLPDLYDTDRSSFGLGDWSLMASGTFVGCHCPTHLDAWSKVTLGWVEPIILASPTELTIPPVETQKAIYKIPITDTEYFLLENRQKIGFDATLPAGGLLIYHVDEAVRDNDNEWYPGCTSCTSHYLVALEQADGRWDLEKKINFGDSGDPFPGSTNNTAFTDTSIPNSRAYSGVSTGISITNIRQENQNIRLTFGNPPPDPPPSADLSVTQTDSPDPVIVGNQFTYTLTASNSGPSDATGVILSDNLPSSVTFISSSSTQGSCSGTSTITCSLGALKKNSSATVRLTVTAHSEGTLINSASVSASESDPNPSNNTDKENTTVRPAPVIPTADLSITQTDTPDPATVGNPLIYTITVKNSGPSEATGVTLTDTLPAGVSLTSITPGQGSCAPSADKITCTLGNLPAGKEVTVALTVTPSAPEAITNTASVTASETDPNSANNTDKESTKINPPTEETADLSVRMVAAPDPITLGSNLVYTLTVTNHGPDAATAVVSDIIIGPATVLSIHPSQGSCTGATVISCSLGNVNNQKSATIEIIVAPSEAGTISNTATVTSGTSDPNSQNNSAAFSTLINPPPPDDQGGGAGPIPPDQPGDATPAGSNTQETPPPSGGGGGGCAMSPTGEPDVTLPAMLCGIFIYLTFRKKQI